MGGKVNEAGSKLLRGQEEGKDYPTRHDWLSRGRQRRAREAAQVTATSRPAAGHRRLGRQQAEARKYEWPPGKSHDSGHGPDRGSSGIPGRRPPGKAAPSQGGEAAEPPDPFMRQQRRPGAQTDLVPLPRAG